MFVPCMKKRFRWGTVGGAGHARFGFGHSRPISRATAAGICGHVQLNQTFFERVSFQGNLLHNSFTVTSMIKPRGKFR